MQWRIQGFPKGGGANLVVGRQLLLWLHTFRRICQNERIRTLQGHAPAAPSPLDPPIQCTIWSLKFTICTHMLVYTLVCNPLLLYYAYKYLVPEFSICRFIRVLYKSYLSVSEYASHVPKVENFLFYLL